MEMTAVIMSDRWVLKLGAAGLALALIGGAASAQQKAPPEPKATPKAETKAPVKKKAASPCKGLAEAACGGNTACSWVKASKTKAGKDIRAYCRLKPVAKKK